MAAEVIPFDLKDQEPKCSFCKTPKSKSKNMVVSSTGKAICDKCLKTCTNLISPKEVA
jgi:hypothetical protein